MGDEIIKSEEETTLPAETAAADDNLQVREESAVPAKKESITKKIMKKIGLASAEGMITEALMETLLPKLKPMIKKAKPQMIEFLKGLNDETGEFGDERIIVVRLTKGKDDAIVQIMKKHLMNVQIAKGREAEAYEQVHSAEEWAMALMNGDYGKLFKTEVDAPEKEGEKEA